jgi:hypothetical protein
MQCGARGDQDEVVDDIVTDITNPWWRAAALAAVDMSGKSEAGDLTSRQAATAVASIPKGDSRTRLQQLVASAAIGAGRPAVALPYIADISTGRDIRLMNLGRLLSATGDADMLMQFIPRCKSSASLSLFACCLLAELHPEQAAAIATEVAAYGSSF